MPNPKYTKIPQWDAENSAWVTELPMHLNGFDGKSIIVELDPDAEFTYEYEEQQFNEETGLMETVTKTKTDWKEIQTIFVANHQQEDEVLSVAAWNHYRELNKRLTVEKPEQPVEDPVDALPEEDLPS